MIRALLVMLVSGLLLAAFFGGIAPGIAPVFDTVEDDAAVQSDDSPVGPGIITTIRDIVFIYAPLILLGVGIGFPLIYAIRRGRFAQ
jgi:hypothetical protein